LVYFAYFKIRGDLEEVALMKSVPNCISYLHHFSAIFLSLELFFLSYFHSNLIEIEEKTANVWGLLVGVSVARRYAPVG
jgi:hypothetical protein